MALKVATPVGIRTRLWQTMGRRRPLAADCARACISPGNRPRCRSRTPARSLMPMGTLVQIAYLEFGHGRPFPQLLSASVKGLISPNDWRPLPNREAKPGYCPPDLECGWGYRLLPMASWKIFPSHCDCAMRIQSIGLQTPECLRPDCPLLQFIRTIGSGLPAASPLHGGLSGLPAGNAACDASARPFFAW